MLMLTLRLRSIDFFFLENDSNINSNVLVISSAKLPSFLYTRKSRQKLNFNLPQGQFINL